MFAALPPGTPGNWSLFDANGKVAVPFDTFFACTVKAESKVASSPVEKRAGKSGFVVEYRANVGFSSRGACNIGFECCRYGCYAQSFQN